MRTATHAFTAGLVAFVIAVFFVEFELTTGLFFWPYVGLAYLAGILPDRIEPPTSWQHRAKWHSERCLQAMLILLIVGWAVGMLTGYFFLMFFALGYVIHLVEDATTPVGLPRQ